ncbi:hypothetical protein Micbo1qcDRAFT_176220 [Microdochium bolleyi]|uniref:Uncharacterized protein n=1 Tax=Microdochium bolleyi TaxID=196109 RepID=A0A136J020_9PEZI|nr:hypothetical protein Micbo1qcDRAFT_176220 [Microdochium bolleyi]
MVHVAHRRALEMPSEQAKVPRTAPVGLQFSLTTHRTSPDALADLLLAAIPPEMKGFGGKPGVSADELLASSCRLGLNESWHGVYMDILRHLIGVDLEPEPQPPVLADQLEQTIRARKDAYPEPLEAVLSLLQGSITQVDGCHLAIVECLEKLVRVPDARSATALDELPVLDVDFRPAVFSRNTAVVCCCGVVDRRIPVIELGTLHVENNRHVDVRHRLVFMLVRILAMRAVMETNGMDMYSMVMVTNDDNLGYLKASSAHRRAKPDANLRLRPGKTRHLSRADESANRESLLQAQFVQTAEPHLIRTSVPCYLKRSSLSPSLSSSTPSKHYHKRNSQKQGLESACIATGIQQAGHEVTAIISIQTGQAAIATPDSAIPSSARGKSEEQSSTKPPDVPIPELFEPELTDRGRAYDSRPDSIDANRWSTYTLADGEMIPRKVSLVDSAEELLTVIYTDF